MNLAPAIHPRLSFMPTLINALSQANPDPATKKFVGKLGPKLTKQLLDNWKKLNGQQKAERYFLSRTWRPSPGDLAAQLEVFSKGWQAARAQLIANRKKIIKTEIDRALLEGIGRYVPSSYVLKDKTLAYEILKKFWQKLHGCRCDEEGSPETPAPKPKFGLKVTRIKCHDQRETGNDEIYLVSAVVDGNGQLVTTVSGKYSIDDGSDDIVYPNYWIYPMQDPNGFLDAGVSMWEDDGGYSEAGQTVAAIGGALATLPNPYTLVAGVGLTIIGEVISLASWLDDDDHYGDAYKNWGSQTALNAGIGSYTLGFYEVDEGWFDDGHDLDVRLNLTSA